MTEGWRPHALLAGLILITFWPCIRPGVMNIDTPWLVVGNPLLNQGDPASIGPILWDMATGTRRALGAEYLPVRDLSVLLDFALFGPNFTLHHAVNLGIYLLGCLVFLRICQGLMGPRPLSFLAAALFALHPLQVEPVAWLASRKGVLALLFFNLALLAWLRGRTQIRWFFASVLLYLLAVWSKSPAIVLPGVIVAISLCIKGDPISRPWLKQWIPYGGVTAMATAIGLALGRQMDFFTAPLAEGVLGRISLTCRLYAHYLGAFLWPRQLSVYYAPPPELPLTSPQSLGAIALMVGLFALVVGLRKGMPLVSGGIAWFIVALIPVSQLLPLQWIMADRYMLFPAMGLAIAAAALLGRIPLPTASRPRLSRGLRLAVAIGLIVALAGQGRAQAELWRSPVALWQRAFDANPPSEKTYAYLAGAYLAEGDRAGALRVAQEGAARFPESPRLVQLAGGIHLQEGRTEEARALLERAVALDPDVTEPKAYSQLMVLYTREGRDREAAELGDRLVRRHPRYWQGWNTFAVALMGLKAWPQAAQALDQALILAPYESQVQCNRAAAAYNLGRYGEARSHWETCLRLEPGNADAAAGLEHLGVARP